MPTSALQSVQHIIDPPTCLARWSREDRKSCVVIIGRDLPRDAFLDSLEVPKSLLIAHTLPA
jgi:G3E family GTPase